MMPSANLRVAAASFALDLATSEELTGLADELLCRGIYSESLGELSLVRYPVWTEVSPLFGKALKELGVPLPPPQVAASTLVRQLLWGIAERGYDPREGQRLLEAVYYGSPSWKGLWAFIRDDCGCRNLVSCFHEREYLASLIVSGDVEREVAEGDLAAIERSVLEFAELWIQERCPIGIDPGWRVWNGGCVLKLAQSIRDEGRFGDLLVLADALEEAGCTDQDILEHCRQPGPHVRRCLVVDALLERD